MCRALSWAPEPFVYPEKAWTLIKKNILDIDVRIVSILIFSGPTGSHGPSGTHLPRETKSIATTQVLTRAYAIAVSCDKE